MGNEGGREAATCNITVLTNLSGSVHKCASKPASERATERQRRFGLPDRTALPLLPLRRRRRGGVISAPLAPPPALLPSRWRRRGGGGGRQTDVCPTLKSSLSLFTPGVPRSFGRSVDRQPLLARSPGWSRRLIHFLVLQTRFPVPSYVVRLIADYNTYM